MNCPLCNHRVGTRRIHDNLHELINEKPYLATTPYNNEILIEYWKRYNGFGTKTLVPKDLESYQSIDREIRHVVGTTQPRKAIAEQYRQHYGSHLREM